MIPASMHLGQRHHDRATELEDRVKEGVVKAEMVGNGKLASTAWRGSLRSHGSHAKFCMNVSSSQSHENNGRRFECQDLKDEAKQSKTHPICPFSPTISGLRFLGL